MLNIYFISPGQAQATKQYPAPAPPDNLTTFVENQATSYTLTKG